MLNTRYKVTIANWQKHQKKLKAGHTHFMLSKRFFDDEKVSLLKQNECLLFINLLVIAADLMSDSFVIHTKLLPNLLRIGDKSLHNCLDRLQSFQLLTYEKDASNIREYNIKEYNIRESNNNGGEIVEKKSDENLLPEVVSTQARKSSPRGCINEFSFDPISVEMLKNVTEPLQIAWFKAYPNAQWICHEIRKANAWCEANPKKRPKDFGRFMNTWLSNGFEQYRKSLPSNKQVKTFASQIEENNLNLIRKFEEEEKDGN